MGEEQRDRSTPLLNTFSIYTVLECFCSSTEKHSLKHLRTATSGIPNVPDFVAVVFVDGYQTEYYDSISRKTVPTQTWMNRATEDDPDYWERQTSFWRGKEQSARANIEFYKEGFNRSGGTFTEH
uniref:MHC class I-like antigen recognition-like domain-containing protein n=1 Tax=Sparus aurata TaxID=8175 RepID=A0A671V004_SPAAU